MGDDELCAALGEAVNDQLQRGPAIEPRYLRDWSPIEPGAPLAVVRPATTAEVAAVLKLCHAARRPVVPQGGRTGLAGAAVPGAGEVVLSLERLTGVEEVDASGATLVARAGTPIATVQDAAADHGLMLPLDLGSRGSATVGGTIATNAGGNRVLRYGMMRDMVLGLEAVLADGTVLSGLNRMLKNNAGYDLKHLFIGSEGTLGVVTRAVLRLRARPRSRATALCAINDFDHVVDLLRHLDGALGGQLSAFEVMWRNYYAPAVETVGQAPLSPEHAFTVLIESQGGEPAADAARFEAALDEAMTGGLVAEAVVARSGAEETNLWAVRDAIADMASGMAPYLAYDVSLPTAAMERFVNAALAALERTLPDHRSVVFGHVADGNLHLVSHVDEAAHDKVDALIFGLVADAGGSISAEHGIGRLKRAYLDRSRSPEEIATMRAMKRALDPHGILSPGRVF